MPTIDKSAEETFSLTEEGSHYLKEPDVYSLARANLLSYRSKVMKDLVGGRVEALLDAGHDSLVKYKTYLGKLDVVAYLFQNLRRNALALQFKSKDIGDGSYHNVSEEYVAPVTSYPLNPPYAVPQRMLPQVDVFRWTPFSDMDLSELSALAQCKTLVLVQTDKAVFKNNPDVENALYDFYYFYAQCRVRGRWQFINPVDPNYEYWTGEYVHFIRELRTANIETAYLYHVDVWLELGIELGAGAPEPRKAEPVMSWITTQRREHNVFITPSNAPVVPIIISGSRIKSDDETLWGIGAYAEHMVGYYTKATSFTVVGAESVNWYNAWKITISVNDKVKGTTNPAPDTYTKRALDGFEVTASPNPTYSFDHWELEGLNIGNANPYYVYPLKDEELKAIFV